MQFSEMSLEGVLMRVLQRNRMGDIYGDLLLRIGSRDFGG